jgi:hypothetical protein
VAYFSADISTEYNSYVKRAPFRWTNKAFALRTAVQLNQSLARNCQFRLLDWTCPVIVGGGVTALSRLDRRKQDRDSGSGVP